MAHSIRATSALCPSCLEVLPATLAERGDDVYLEMCCPEHGPVSNLYFRDVELFRSLLRLKRPLTCCPTYDCARGAACTQRAKKTTIYLVNVTNRCNMACRACCSGSATEDEELEIAGPRLLADLPEVSNRKVPPQVVFIGGEPTLHSELPEMIREVRRRGYVPEVATNGLRLNQPGYARELADAGLGWVFVHFDSLDDEVNLRLRGRAMVETCHQAIDNCLDVGMKVQLGMTVVPENVGEIGALLELAVRKGVFWVSLYPEAEIGRSGGSEMLFLSDVLGAIEQQTGGQIRVSDFVDAARTWSRIHRLTRRIKFRQIPTMLSLPVIAGRKSLVPVNRLMSPLSIFRWPRELAVLLRSIPRFLRYETRPPAADTLVLSIQQLQSRSALDLEEATQSFMSYVHEESFLPFDVFNHVHRYPCGGASNPVTDPQHQPGGGD